MTKALYTLSKLNVVIDNNVFQDFYELECMGLLFDITDLVMIPRSIIDEMLPEVKTSLEHHDFEIKDITSLGGYQILTRLFNEDKYKALSLKDKLCIAIAGEQLVYCGSNDKPVRKACKDFNIHHTGTLGMLARAYYLDKLNYEKLIHYLNLLKSDQTSCYLADKVIDDFIKSIKKVR